jgi:crossover junction endodeoxyribonuclease RusA
MSWALDLFVAGTPAPQGSKRHVGGGRMIESSAAVGDWRTVVAWTAANEYAPRPPITGAVVLAVEFVMPRPKSLPKRKPTPPHTKRPDVDKLLRAVGDAMSGVVWADDSQVVQAVGSKRYAELDETPGAHMLVGELDPATLVADDAPTRPAA